MADGGFMQHPLAALTLARFRLTIREPEIVFWIFVFPILMALALGIAFQARGEEPVPVAVRNAPGAAPVLAALAQTGDLEAFAAPEGDELTLLRDDRAHLVVVPGSPPTYRYDPVRPESRLARLLVDRALAGEAGHDPAGAARTGRGGDARQPLHRLAGAWPAGHEHHGLGHVGARLRHRGGRGRASC